MRWIVGLAGLATTLGAAPLALADIKSDCIDASEESQRLRDDGKFLLARQKLLICARQACPDPVEQECLASLVALDRDAPSLIFAARDQRGKDTRTAQVFLDGQLVADALDGRPLPVDPGEHTARFVIPNAPPVEQHIVVRVGERNRLVTVDFEQKAPPPSPTPATTTTPASPVSASRPIALPVIMGGIGLAALGAFGYFGWTGKSEIDDLKATCGKTHGCAQSDVDAADRKLLAADVFLGVGVVSLGVTTVLLLSGGKSEPTSAKAAIDVHPTTGGLQAAFSSSF